MNTLSPATHSPSEKRTSSYGIAALVVLAAVVVLCLLWFLTMRGKPHAQRLPPALNRVQQLAVDATQLHKDLMGLR